MPRFPVVLAICLTAVQAWAAPRIPARDEEVLEQLPLRRNDPQAAALRELRARLSGAPDDPRAASALARRYFHLAAGQGDPRYVGYAQAALQPWSGRRDAPAEVLRVRGMLHQYRHEFDRALEDFGNAARLDPSDAEAHAWRAAVLMVRAEYAEAARECAAVASLGEALQGEGCSAYVQATTGGTRAAHDRLSRALAGAGDVEPGLRLWLLTRLAEMAWRLGNIAAAERHFRAALELGVADNFLLASYAEFLLEQGREREVVALLAGSTRSDVLLLRLALAERALGMPDAARHAQILGERFAAAALRGERLHLADEARYLLDFRGDAAGALAAAAENWKVQKEPRDALILLEAARAAGQPAAARPALEWLARTGFEDQRMRRLASELR